MPRYVAFLRGVSPMNAKMPEVKRCFEGAGFTNVKTLLSSGNVVFDARVSKQQMLAARAEKAMQAGLGRTFATTIRAVAELEALVAEDAFAAFDLPPNAKRVVTFLKGPPATKPKLPIERDGARILAMRGADVLSAYVVGDKGPVFMVLLERTFGKDITTRTLGTVRKCIEA